MRIVRIAFAASVIATWTAETDPSSQVFVLLVSRSENDGTTILFRRGTQKDQGKAQAFNTGAALSSGLNRSPKDGAGSSHQAQPSNTRGRTDRKSVDSLAPGLRRLRISPQKSALSTSLEHNPTPIGLSDPRTNQRQTRRGTKILPNPSSSIRSGAGGTSVATDDRSPRQRALDRWPGLILNGEDPYTSKPVQIHTDIRGPADIHAGFGKDLQKTARRTVAAGSRFEHTWTDPYAAEVSIDIPPKNVRNQNVYATGSHRASIRGQNSPQKHGLGTGREEYDRPQDISINAHKAENERGTEHRYLRVSTRLPGHSAALHSAFSGEGMTVLRASNSHRGTDSDSFLSSWSRGSSLDRDLDDMDKMDKG